MYLGHRHRRFMRKKPFHTSRRQEMLTAYDDEMNEIGVFSRSHVHYNGMWHRVCQCWIVGADSKSVRIYLQRRSFEKKSNPGRYDVAAGGHIMAGEDIKRAMMRELREETGLDPRFDELIKIGTYREVSNNDHEIAEIFLYMRKNPPFSPGNEVIYMVSADIDEYKQLSEGNRDSITVIPAIKTGPMEDEAFEIGIDNICNHESFPRMVYPFIMKKLGKMNQ